MKRTERYLLGAACAGLLTGSPTWGSASGGPQVLAVFPSSGTTAGSTQVTVAGSGFTGATDLFFGAADVSGALAYPCSGSAGGCFLVNSDSQITAYTPAHAQATVDVEVQAGGLRSLANPPADQFSYVASTPRPAVLDVHAGPAAGGTQLTVTPTSQPGGYSFTTGVNFSTTPTTTVSATCTGPGPFANCFTVNSDNSVTVFTPAAPAGAADAPVDTTITTAGGTSALNSTPANDQFTWATAPSVVSLNGVTSGGENGGTTITVTGTHFRSSPAGGYQASEVDFVPTVSGTTYSVTSSTCGDGCFTVNSATQLTVTTPSAAPGTYDLEVVTPGGHSAATPADHFTFNPAVATVTAVVPSQGPAAGGQSVTISGSGFIGVSEVDFGTLPAAKILANPCPQSPTTPCFTVVSPTQIVAVTPPSTAALPPNPTLPAFVNVQVVNPSGASATSSNDRYFYYALPTVSSVSPTSDAPGATGIVVHGTNFVSSADVSEVDLVPISGSTGPALQVTTVGCGSPPPGGCFTVDSATQITLALPSAIASGTYDTVVVTPGGASGSSSSDQLSVTMSTPTVTNVNPNAGPAGGGQSVVVTGTNFQGLGWTTSALHFGGANVTAACPQAPGVACYTVDSPTQITAVSPNPGSNEQVDVTATITSNDATETLTSATSSADLYSFALTPTVTAVSPGGGPAAGLTQVTLTGTNFTGDSGGFTAGSVQFGGAQVTTSPCPGSPASPCFTVNGATQITVYTPPHAAGVVDATVTTPGGTSAISNSDRFLYIAPVPAVSGVSPSTGSVSGGTQVTITGSGFTATTDVFFGGTDVSSANTYPCPGSTAGCFNVDSDTQITVFTPQHAAGQLDVTVITAGGTSPASGSDAYTFQMLPPTVSAVSPPAGPLAGGQTITVTGTNFTGPGFNTIQVAFGATTVLSNPCAASPGPGGCFSVDSATQITAVTPGAPAGQVHVVITTQSLDATVGPLNSTPVAPGDDVYTFAPVPSVSALSSAAGPIGGGNSLTISGTNFSGAGFTTTGVRFGNTNISNNPCPGSPSSPCFTLNSATQITVGYVPPSATGGQVNVRVSTPGGTSAIGSPNLYTYAPLPTVSGLSPTFGPLGGATATTISGSNFKGTGFATTSVHFGTTAISSNPCPGTPIAPCFTVNSAGTQITVGYIPAGAGGGPVDVSVITQSGTSALGAADRFTYVAPGSYTALAPFRILDTRAAPLCNHCGAGALNAGESRTMAVTGITGPQAQSVPSNALAVVLNVTSVNGSAGSFLTLYPSGASQPAASNLNFLKGTNAANLAVVALGTGGQVVIFNAAGTVNVVVDVEGYFAPPSGSPVAGEFHPIAPLRLCDSRAGTGTECSGTTSDKPLGPGAVMDVNLAGLPPGAAGGTPSVPGDGTAASVALNLTAVNGTGGTYLSVFPPDGSDHCSTSTPAFSNLNVAAHENRPNRVIVPLGPNHDVCVYNNSGSVNFILDLNGWFGTGHESSAGTLFYAIPPTRICDTRTGSGAPECSGAPVANNSTLKVNVAGIVGIPPAGGSAAPMAVIANVTAVSGTRATFFTFYPADVTRPAGSDLNVSVGENIPNLVIVQLAVSGGSSGAAILYNNAGSIDAVVDVAGWFH
jgi:hypothetical protein